MKRKIKTHHNKKSTYKKKHYNIRHTYKQKAKKTKGGQFNYIIYDEDTQSYFPLLLMVLPSDKRFHTLLEYDEQQHKIKYRKLDDNNRITFTPHLKQHPNIPTNTKYDTFHIRLLLHHLVQYMDENLWRLRITHGDATDSNIIYDPQHDTLVLIDWEEIRLTHHEHKFLERKCIDLINVVTAIEKHYPFAFQTNVWNNPLIQHILQNDKTTFNNENNILTDDELRNAITFLLRVAHMEIR